MADHDNAGFYATEDELKLLEHVSNDPALLLGKLSVKEGNGLLAVCKALAAQNAMEGKMHMSLMGRASAPALGNKRVGSSVIRVLVFDIGGADIPNQNALTILWCSKAPQALANKKREQAADVEKRQEALDLRASTRTLMGEGYIAKSAGCCFLHVSGDCSRVVSNGVDGDIHQLLWVPKETLPKEESIEESLQGKFFLQPFAVTEPLIQKDIADFKINGFTADSADFMEWMGVFSPTLKNDGALKATISKLLKPKEVGQTSFWDISTCIPEAQRAKYRDASLEIFMPDFESFEYAVSIARPPVLNFKAKLDLYMWKQGGCVKPGLEIADWHAQMAKNREAANTKQAKDKEDVEKKAQEKVEAKKKKDKEKAKEKALTEEKAKEKAEERAKKKEEEDARKEEEGRKRKEEEDARKVLVQAALTEARAKEAEDAKKAQEEADKEDTLNKEDTLKKLTAKASPPELPHPDTLNIVTREEVSLLYVMKKANEEIAARLITEERLAELMLTIVESLHDCVKRFFGTKRRPKKGKGEIQTSFERLKVNGFFDRGLCCEAAWKKVFPSIWKEDEEEEEEGDHEHKGNEGTMGNEGTKGNEGTMSTRATWRKVAWRNEDTRTTTDLAPGDAELEQAIDAEEQEKEAVVQTPMVGPVVGPMVGLMQASPPANNEDKKGNKDKKYSVVEKKEKKEKKNKKGKQDKKDKETVNAAGHVKRESEKYAGRYYWYDPKKERKVGWCDDEESEDSSEDESADSSDSSLGDPPPEKKNTKKSKGKKKKKKKKKKTYKSEESSEEESSDSSDSSASPVKKKTKMRMMPSQFGFQNPGPMVLPNQGQMMIPNQGQMMIPNQGQMMVPNQFGFQGTTNQGQMAYSNQGQMMMMPSQFGFQNPMTQGQVTMTNQGQMMMMPQPTAMQGQMVSIPPGQMMVMPPQVPQSFDNFTMQDETRRRKKKK